MRTLKRLYYKIFKRYRIIERRVVDYIEADRLIKSTAHLPEPEQWDVDFEKEDNNRVVGVCYVCRKERILE